MPRKKGRHLCTDGIGLHLIDARKSKVLHMTAYYWPLNHHHADGLLVANLVARIAVVVVTHPTLTPPLGSFTVEYSA